jgi:D-alanyl-D-alanine dipeptidase
MEEIEKMSLGFRISSLTSSAAWILIAALAFQPPSALAQRAAAPVLSNRPLRASDLLEIVRLDSTIHLDIRYATANNFMKRPMYTRAQAFLQRPAVEALLRAHRSLRKHGFGVLVFDGYRPWRVTKKFWDETEPSKRSFVADPAKGSKHNRGCAVDCSLYDLKTGTEVGMPTPYDDFSPDAAARAHAGTAGGRKLRDLLRRAMEAEGFRVEPNEWWHFDYSAWREYPIQDLPFEQLP